MIQADPKNASGYSNRGSIWLAKGEYGKALADCREAIRLDPKNLAHWGVAWIEAASPDPAFRNGREAVANAEKARQLFGLTDSFHTSVLAAAYAESGDFDAATRAGKRRPATWLRRITSQPTKSLGALSIAQTVPARRPAVGYLARVVALPGGMSWDRSRIHLNVLAQLRRSSHWRAVFAEPFRGLCPAPGRPGPRRRASRRCLPNRSW